MALKSVLPALRVTDAAFICKPGNVDVQLSKAMITAMPGRTRLSFLKITEASCNSEGASLHSVGGIFIDHPIRMVITARERKQFTQYRIGLDVQASSQYAVCEGD